MGENEPVRIRIRSRKQAGAEVHDVTVTVNLTLSNSEFWSLAKAYKPSDPTAFLYSIYLYQTAVQQEKQRLLAETIEKKRENNPSNIRPIQERNQQGSDREPDTGESGETYDKERRGEEEAGKLPALGLARANRETGYYTFTAEAGS